MQGTVYGVRLARAGHRITLVARGKRAEELRGQGAAIRNAIDGRSDLMNLPVVDGIAPNCRADLCFVFVRREQIEDVLPSLSAASAVERIVFMVNHANVSERLFAALGRRRVVLGFPSVAGGIENGVDVYVDVAEQPTTIESTAPDIAAMLQEAGFRVAMVADVDSWLRRHAVFVTAIGGALYLKNGRAGLLASDKKIIGTMILAVREGWAALDRRGDAAPPFPLRTIFCWVPFPFAVAYWSRVFRSARGEYYFARHVRQAPAEMAALAGDVRQLIRGQPAPHLELLYDAIDRRQSA